MRSSESLIPKKKQKTGEPNKLHPSVVVVSPFMRFSAMTLEGAKTQINKRFLNCVDAKTKQSPALMSC